MDLDFINVTIISNAHSKQYNFGTWKELII